jgi:methionyl-tRNA formyltransferase
VVEIADARGLQVLSPARAGDPELVEQLRSLAPDACPVVAYGALVPSPVVAIPRLGWVNLHFSLLPAWRGAAPVQRALMAGDEITGASTFLLEEGLDTGPLLGTLTEQIRPRDTAGDLLGRLSVAGAELLVATLDGLEEGTLTPVPQPSEGVSHAPKLTVGEARVDWSRPDYAVDRHIRGCTPSPGAWTTFRGDRLKLQPVLPVDDPVALDPGELLMQRTTVLVGTATAPVRLGGVQPPGKRSMPATDWARGARLEPGEALGG